MSATPPKAGRDGPSGALAAGAGPCGTTVGSVEPGTCATEADAEPTAGPGWERRLRGRTAPGRRGRPEEVAVDGGMTTTS
ncbi:hypothetical protein FRZ03_10735 [Streptomyces misionensis]|uniref:Uncharacterized protein n=1 Tax=Streptomyces misionensis TaxID=67331 RepID=A0A5C6JX39_9ACTN|nr:hypothetical protein [Streptomyces misionensis]TWV53406.1 hypothetical protein FRZ03_10735 [Streptomyces misionensis]